MALIPSHDAILEAAERAMTSRQLEVWTLHVRRGWSFQKIGWNLGVSKSTAFGHFKEGQRRLVVELEERKAA